MTKTRPNPMETIKPPHVRAFVLQQELQVKLFNTDIMIYSCDRKNQSGSINTENPKSVVLLIIKNKSDEEIAKIEQAGQKLKDRDIECIICLKGSENIYKYLGGDF